MLHGTVAEAANSSCVFSGRAVHFRMVGKAPFVHTLRFGSYSKRHPIAAAQETESAQDDVDAEAEGGEYAPATGPASEWTDDALVPRDPGFELAASDLTCHETLHGSMAQPAALTMTGNATLERVHALLEGFSDKFSPPARSTAEALPPTPEAVACASEILSNVETPLERDSGADAERYLRYCEEQRSAALRDLDARAHGLTASVRSLELLEVPPMTSGAPCALGEGTPTTLFPMASGVDTTRSAAPTPLRPGSECDKRPRPSPATGGRGRRSRRAF